MPKCEKGKGKRERGKGKRLKIERLERLKQKAEKQ
jgi:hypothetical protein